MSTQKEPRKSTRRIPKWVEPSPPNFAEIAVMAVVNLKPCTAKQCAGPLKRKHGIVWSPPRVARTLHGLIGRDLVMQVQYKANNPRALHYVLTEEGRAVLAAAEKASD